MSHDMPTWARIGHEPALGLGDHLPRSHSCTVHSDAGSVRSPERPIDHMASRLGCLPWSKCLCGAWMQRTM